MISASFSQSNAALSKPADMPVDECHALSVWRGRQNNGLPIVVSCWKLTQEELEEFQRTGRIWLIVAGVTMPPVSLTAQFPWSEGDDENTVPQAKHPSVDNLLNLCEQLQRGCSCGYDHRCSNCQRILDVQELVKQFRS